MSTIIGTLFLLVAVNYCCFITTTLNIDHNNSKTNDHEHDYYYNDNDYLIYDDDTSSKDVNNDGTKLIIPSKLNDNVNEGVVVVLKNNDYDHDEPRARGFRKIRERWRSMRRINRLNEERLLRQSIKFIYHKNNDRTHETIDEGSTQEEYIGECKITDKFAFILHGWRQSCEVEWMPKVIERLSHYRGGCIVCIDFSSFAKENYMWLYRHFKIISELITIRIFKLIDQGFDPKNGYMFGFSYGGQLATSVGQFVAAGVKPFKSIDTCDMAGPGFDLMPLIDHRGAAENVQCLHSSRDKGTRIYACHQNVRLGNCGWSQPAEASQPTYSSHGLCVQIYINAFDHPFYALPNKPSWCLSTNPAIDVPQPFTIGYSGTHNPRNISGEIFVPTGLYYPYNDPLDNLKPTPAALQHAQRRYRPYKRRRFI